MFDHVSKALKVPGLVGISRIWGYSEPHTRGQTTLELAKNWSPVRFWPKVHCGVWGVFLKKNLGWPTVYTYYFLLSVFISSSGEWFELEGQFPRQRGEDPPRASRSSVPCLRPEVVRSQPSQRNHCWQRRHGKVRKSFRLQGKRYLRIWYTSLLLAPLCIIQLINLLHQCLFMMYYIDIEQCYQLIW